MGMSDTRYHRLLTALTGAVREVLHQHDCDAYLALTAGDALSKLAMVSTGELLCAVCGFVKPVGEFYLAAGKPETFCKACRKAKVGEWRAANPDWEKSPRVRARRRANAKAHPERAVESMRRWRKKHPDAARLEARMAARLRRTPGLRASILARDGCCLRCGALADLVIDHIKPVLSGGDNDPGNLQTLCRSCNSKKRGAVDHRRTA